MVALADVRANEYALYSLRIGDATHLSAVGASPETLQREGRWAFDDYKAYVCSNGKDARHVATVMAKKGVGNGIQPGQDTDCRQVSPIPKLEE